jgi:hypothetical protein
MGGRGNRLACVAMGSEPGWRNAAEQRNRRRKRRATRVALLLTALVLAAAATAAFAIPMLVTS